MDPTGSTDEDATDEDVTFTGYGGPAGGRSRARVPLLDLLLATLVPAGSPRSGPASAAAESVSESGPGSLPWVEAATRRSNDVAPGATVPVLVVADTEQRRASLRTRLEADGMATVEAPDEAGALAIAGSTRPAVAVVDLRPPDSVGLEIARRLRREHPTTRVVLHAGVVTPSAITAARQVGAFALVLEHAAEDRLVELVRAAIT